jgi:hypothetical protein
VDLTAELLDNLLCGFISVQNSFQFRSSLIVITPGMSGAQPFSGEVLVLLNAVVMLPLLLYTDAFEKIMLFFLLARIPPTIG